MSVQPQNGEYFVADDLIGMFFYGQCIESGAERVFARMYSRLCPEGESGSYPVANIFKVISKEEFEEAKEDGWPG